MIFGKRAAQAPSRAQILKRGLVGIAVVLVLAFIASFLGGGSDAPAPKDQQTQGDQKPKNQQNNSQSEDEGSAIDAKDLLGAEPDAPSSSGDQRVPASRKFDYSAGMDDDQGAQDGALEPPKGTAPASEPMAQPAPGQASSAEGGDGEAVPVQDAEEPLPAPAPAQGHDGALSAPSSSQPEPAPAPAATPAPAPAPAPASTPAPAPAPAATPAPAPAQAPAAKSEAQQQPAQPAKESTGAVLYCGSFGTSHQAEEQKALLAFQGQRAAVVKRSGSYTLKLGPYKTKAAARAEFSKLDQAGLVSECALEDN